MGGGGSKSGKQTNTIRYAPYIESRHDNLLARSESYGSQIINSSPFANYSDIDYLSGFFGIGYTIASFPSLYDMYGKFMAGLDIEAVFTQVLNDSINNAAIGNRIAAHGVDLNDEVDNVSIPKLSVGMRDINSVMSSSFIVARSIIESNKVKALSKYDAELRAAMLPVAAQRFTTHLNWNSDVIKTYIDIMRTYFNVATAVDDHNYGMRAKDKLWPFTVMDYQRVILGTLQGATKSTSDVAGASTAAKAVGGAMAGAAAGYMVGNAPGAVIGGLIGLGAAFL